MTHAPRVLVSGVVLNQPMGGVRRHNRELLPRLARLLADAGGGLAVMEGRERVGFELPPPIEVLRADVPAAPVLARARAESQALRRATDDARRAGRAFDVIHTAHLPAPRGLDVPFTWTVHDLRALERGHALRSGGLFGTRIAAPFRAVPRFLARGIVRDAARRAAHVFTVSRAVAEDLCSVLDLEPGAITVIGNGGDHFEPRPRAAGPDAPIVCIGHLEPRKNLELVLRALALDPTLPRVTFHGAAKPGELERLRALARDLRIEARVTFAGPFEDAELPTILARAACVCLPSTIEGFGIGVVEAQRARVPLCVARTRALLETAGARTPAFDPTDAAEAARALHAALAATAAALEDAERRARAFTWDAAARRWFEALLHVHATRGSR